MTRPRARPRKRRPAVDVAATAEAERLLKLAGQQWRAAAELRPSDLAGGCLGMHRAEGDDGGRLLPRRRRDQGGPASAPPVMHA